MNYKTILVHVDESRHAPERVKLAATIAQRCGAHLIGMAATALPGAFYLPGALGEGVSLTAYLGYLRERADSALAVFEATVQGMNLSDYEMRVIEDEAAAGISLHARTSDLVIVGQTDPEEALPAMRNDFPEHVVMNSGRPTLIVPHGRTSEQIGKRVIVAWDSGIEAARAVAGALPLLREADSVQVVIFHNKPKPGSHVTPGVRPGKELLQHLTRHGVRAEIAAHTLSAGIDNGKALLAHANDFRADMMVMGGYGHSRFREVLLGGVTQTVFSEMAIPTLMAH
jgi:nucleotide-binding universal stress UspA family protein